MATIDERVVSMKFDNKQFHSGIGGTLKALDNLKAKLQMAEGTKGLQDVDAAARRVSFDGLANGIEGISGKFVAMSTVAITALSNITNRAINAGIQLVNSFTLQPINDGFAEYELKMGSIQTILANTSRHGTGLEEVTANLDALNEYADKTIYNFGDMTKNIGLFTNAGIKVDDATSMIKGFSNEAAASGTNAQGAAGAAYQLSQALSAGTIRLMDWRSLQNVGMGNKNMQLGLTDLAEAMGTVSEAGLSGEEIQKDFNGSLEKGWLSADVMSNYLKIMAGDMSDTEMASLGLSDEVIKGFKKQQVMGEEAATKVRTFTQLMDTMKEAVGSSWAETFDIILGDFEVATELFTGINDAIGPLIDKMGDARNNLLQGWADGGGRTALLDGLVAGFEALKNVIAPISDAFRDIFPPVTAQNLIDISNAFRDFMTSLIPGADTMNKLRSTFKGVFAILDIGRMIVMGVAKVLASLFTTASGGASSLLGLTAGFGEFLVKVRDTIAEGQFITKFFDGLAVAVKVPLEFLGALGKALADAFNGDNFGGALGERVKQLGEFGATVKQVFDILFGGDYKGGGLLAEGDAFVGVLINLHDWFKQLGATVEQVVELLFNRNYKSGGFLDAGSPIVQFLRDVHDAFTTFFSTGNFDTILDLFNTGFIVGLVILVKKAIDAITGGLESTDGFIDTFKGAIEGVTDTMSAMQTSLKADALFKIAGAVAILVASIVVLSMIDSDRLASALAGLTVAFTQLGAALYAFQVISSGPGVVKLPFVAAALLILSGAMLLFAAAVRSLSGLEWDELVRGLSGLTVMLAALVGAVRGISGMGSGMITAGIGLIAVAVAVRILTTAVKEFGEMQWESIAKGLTGVATILVALAIFTRLSEANAAGIGQGIGLVLLAASLHILLGVVQQLGAMDMPVLAQGLVAMAAALTAIALAMQIMPANLAFTGAGLVIVASSLLILTNALSSMAQFSWDEIARSLTLLAGAMVILAGSLILMSGTLGGSAAMLVAAGALAVMTPILMQLSQMSWDALLVGLAALGGTLLILSVGMIAMSAAVPGALALVIISGALTLLLPVLMALSAMTWGQIGMGLISLAVALGALGVAGLLMTPVVPVLIGLAAAIALFGVGVMAAGVGVGIFAAGLTALAAAGAAAGVALASFIMSVLGVIPSIVEALGVTLVSIASAIENAAPALVSALVTVLNSLLQAVVDLSPGIAAAFEALITLLITVVSDNLPRLVETGINMLLEFLQGIRDNIGEVMNVATEIILEFLQGIDDNMPKILDKGAETVINFINSLADTIRNREQEMKDAAGNIAGAIIDGLAGGITEGAGKVMDAIGNVTGGALNWAREKLGIRSPSREFFKIGGFTSQGFANGITAFSNGVERAAKGVGDTAMTAIKKSVSSIGQTVSDDVNLNPVIRPVIDLTDVHKGVDDISDALTNQEVALNRSVDLANLNALDWRSNTETQAAREDIQPTQNNFVQNNYSPKELSPSEVYRQTKSLLAMSK